MTKIAFIGGGSVQWVPELVSDFALTETLNGAQLVLHDVDAESLKRMLPLCRRITQQHQSTIQVTATLDRAEALRWADFVVLCISVGGLAAMRNDLEIPEKYGIYQAVGDTVGPGGLARGLRHIPFALQLARDMEQLCPQAWLLNLTNPMTVICRAVTKATRIRAIGLCHEVAGVREGLSFLLQTLVEQIMLKVGGINHLPVIVDCRIGGQDGFARLRQWLAGRDVLAEVDKSEMRSVFEVFNDQLAVKATLFQQTGVLYGAGDRHVAEFFPGFLDEANERGLRYGVRLTTVEHRQEMARQRRDSLDSYEPPDALSGEQLAPIMAALLGGPAGVFVVNVPNRGQIENLPRQAVVECMAFVDASGVWPLSVGELPPSAHAVVAAHVDRQELIVEAGLTGHMELARTALASDPLVGDPHIVGPLFDELVDANTRTLRAIESQAGILNRQQQIKEIEAMNTQQQAASLPPASLMQSEAAYSTKHSTIRQLLQNEQARAILEEYFPGITHHPQLKLAMGMTLQAVAPFVPEMVTKEKLQRVDEALAYLVVKNPK
jgi:alpha-galactosidase